ncbi:MAG: hypothetical protein BroJett003_11790 [Planctomycetota bacterium]|nr:MAG: hypothetical protein BroJett003_11790 [Planctomycetota bacterium]
MVRGIAGICGSLALGLLSADAVRGAARPEEAPSRIQAYAADPRAAVIQASRVLREAGQLDDAFLLLERERTRGGPDEALDLEYYTVKEVRGELTPDEAAVLSALKAQARAESELAIGEIHLGLLRARARLAQGRVDDAVTAANAALDKLAALPTDADRDALRASLEAVMAQARSRRAAVAAGPARRSTPHTMSDLGTNDGTPADGTLSQTAAQNVAAVTSETPLAAPDADTSLEVGIGLRSGPVRVDAQFAAYEQSRLARWGEDPAIWNRVVTYPPDWADLTRMRAAWADGLLYRGPEFVGEDGQTKYTAIYNTADLTADVPHFNSAPVLDLHAMMQAHADRVALRQSSDVFTGSVADLAAGIPLLSFFGGVDEYHVPPMSTGTQVQPQDIQRMIDEVLRER